MNCCVKDHARVIWGQPEVNLPRNALWTPKLVTRTLDQSVTVNWGQRSCMCHLGSTRGQIVQEYHMATKFGLKNPCPEDNTLLGSKVMQVSSGVNQRSICQEIMCGHQNWSDELLTSVWCALVESKVTLSCPGQPEVNSKIIIKQICK